VEEQTISAYQSGSFPQISEEDKELDMTIEWVRLGGELENRVFLTCILLEKFSADI